MGVDVSKITLQPKKGLTKIKSNLITTGKYANT